MFAKLQLVNFSAFACQVKDKVGIGQVTDLHPLPSFCIQSGTDDDLAKATELCTEGCMR